MTLVSVAAATGISSVDSGVEYSHLMRSHGVVGSLDSGLLGESIDYYTGQTDFVATDIHLPGNFALPMAVGRRYHVANQAGGALAGAFGDWDLEIPHIEGVIATSVGWVVENASPLERCNRFGPPPAATVTTPTPQGPVTTTIAASEYALGYSVVVPGKGRHELLLRASGNTLSPSGAYPVVTQDWWAASCVQRYGVPTGTPDQSFLITSPDGVTYTFDRYSTRPYPSYERPADTSQPGIIATLQRDQVWMLPSRITDRFNNWLNYTYETRGSTLRLTEITSSDGRSIRLTYSGDVISSISDGSRTWSYGYTSGSLSSVTLPDGSRWTINFANLTTASWTYSGTTCTSLPSPSFNGSVNGTIQHPSGASGTFTFTVTRHGRNNAPGTCLSNSVGMAYAAVQPSVYDVLSLTRKQISGPRLPSTLTWTLAYAGCSSSSCNPSKTTLMTDALSSSTLYTFGAQYGVDEGMLQSKQSAGSGGGGFLYNEQFTYFSASGQAYPSQLGTPTQVRGDVTALTTLRPVQIRTLTVDGATYTETLGNVDAFGYPSTITSSGSRSKTTTLSYAHNTSAWIIGTLRSQQSGGQTELNLNLDNNNQPTQVYRFGRLDRSISYNGDGTVASVSDGNGHTTRYSNYYRGIPQNIAHPDGGFESANVNSLGNLTSWTNPMGHTTSYGYDAMGRLSSMTPPGGYTGTTISWSTGSGGWTRTESRGSYQKTDSYDAFLRSVQTSEPNGRVVTRTYDAEGRTLFTSYPGSSSGINTDYDRLGRVTSQTDGANEAITYSYGNNSLSVQDRNGNTTSYAFLTYDGPSTAWPTSISTPLTTTTISRDLWGKPTSISRGNVTRSRSYNNQQLLQSATDPESGTTTYGYDVAGNVTAITRAGSVSETRYYDPSNRLATISYSGNDPDVSFSWRHDGQLSSATRGTVSRSCGYNGGDLLISDAISIGSTTYTLGYSYDLNRHLSSQTYPDNTTLTYSPDALGQPQAVGSYATGLRYFPNGAIAQFQYGNGIGHSATQDSRQLPDLVSDYGVFSTAYDYDGNGNPVTLADQLGTGDTTLYLTYDTVNRLRTANAPRRWGMASYTYDVYDNLTADTTGTSTSNFAIDGYQRVNSATIGGITTPLTYDSRGNLIQKGSGASASTYTFNAANLLTGITQGTTTNRYTYDPSGLRVISSSSNNGTPTQQTTSIYDVAGRLIYEIASEGSDRVFKSSFESGEKALNPITTTKYYYLGTHLVAKTITNGTTQQTVYVHTDALGTPIAQTDANKNPIGSSFYLPYGTLYSSSGVGNRVGPGYTGQYADSTGLIYMRARYYDPQLHRFISPDPNPIDTGSALNVNRYNYADNNPYAKSDPSGRCATNDVPGDEQDDGMECPGMAESSAVSDAWEAVDSAISAMGPIGAEVSGVERTAVGIAEEATVVIEETTAVVEEASSLVTTGIEALGARAEQIHEALDPIAQSMRTTAVLSTEEGVTIVAAGARDLAPAQRALLGAEEVGARLSGAHAEVTALEYASRNGLTPQLMAVTRAICPSCATAIEQSGGMITSPTTVTW